MILYHGSNNLFDQFVIDEKYSTHNWLMEGLGIYMINDRSVAESYGKYLYFVDVDEKLISDFTSKKYILSVLKELERKVGIKFLSYINIENVICMILDGSLTITNLYKEITDLLDSNETFYSKHMKLITYGDDCLYVKIKDYFNELVNPVIKYNDNSFTECVYICYKNPELLVIKDIKERF